MKIARSALSTVTVTLTLHCLHCNREFNAQRKSAKYCSDACRISAYRVREGKLASTKKANRLTEKVRKLARSSYGRWLVGQLRRAGTVQVLQGAKSADLKALAALKAACDKANAFKGNSFEISHIYPVEGEDGIGRLLPSNLVIALRSFNRRRGKASPLDLDERLHLAYGDIRFKLKGKETSIAILKRLQRLLGPEFNAWLKSYQVKQSQREVLVKKLRSANPKLKLPATATLDDLKAIADDVEVKYHDLNASESSPEWVAFEQLERVGFGSHPIYKVLACSPEVDLFGPEPSLLPDGFWPFVVEQAMQLLHGEPAIVEFEGKPLSSYLTAAESSLHHAPELADDESL